MNLKITSVKSFAFVGFLSVAFNASAEIYYSNTDARAESFLYYKNKKNEA